jgi:hypothetical protein
VAGPRRVRPGAVEGGAGAVNTAVPHDWYVTAERPG